MDTFVGIAGRWAEIYGNYTIVAAIVMALHLVALLIGGGFAFSADYATLRARRAGLVEQERQLEQLSRTHTIVMGALAVSFVSGVLLALADVEVFINSAFFWIKLGVIALLLLNGAALRSAENKLLGGEVTESGWNRLALYSKLSMAFWIGAVFAGVALTDFAG